MTTALVVGKFTPFHRGHERLLGAAIGAADHVVVLLWSNPDWPLADSETRASWVRQLYPTLTVLTPIDPPHDSASSEDQCNFTRDQLLKHNIMVDLVVSGEDYGASLAATIGASELRVDRAELPVSGTLVRSDIHKNRMWLDPIVYAHFIDRVTIMGAESTGKSTLAKALSKHLRTTWVHEYGREHYEDRNGLLQLEDYVEIARVHRRREDEAALSAFRWTISDTNAITTMMFSHLYERDSLDELRRMASECANRYSKFIVCNDDIPFEQDGWRDTVEWRSRMQGLILGDLASREIPYVVVSGSLPDRIDRAVAFLDGRVPAGIHPPRHDGDLGPRP